MALNQTVMRLMVETELDTSKFRNQFNKALAGSDVKLNFDLGALTKSLGKTQKETQKGFAEAFSKALKEGASKEELRGLLAAHKKDRDAARRADQAAEKSYARRAAALVKGAEQAADTLNKKTADFRAGIAGAFASIGNKDLPGILQGGSGALKAAGGGLQASGGGVGAVAGVGTALAGVGASLAMVAGAIGGLLAVLKVFVDLNDRVKEVNKEILTSQGALASMGKEGANVASALAEIRTTANDWEFNKQWNLNQKEFVGIIAGFQKTGLVLDEMNNGLATAEARTKALQAHAEVALTMSHMLGVDTSEAARITAEAMEGLNQSLGMVKEGFAAVTAEAMQSGFGTKRFFNMVLQATSGISMFNVHLDETAALLTKVSKTLGEKGGGAFTKSLVDGRRGTDIAGQLKMVEMAGLRTMLRIARDESENSARALQKAIEGANEQVGPALKKSLEAVGIRGAMAMSPADLAKALAGLSRDQKSRLRTEFESADPKMGRRVLETLEWARAGFGKGNQRTRAAFTAKNMGATGAMQAALSALQKKFGAGVTVDDINKDFTKKRFAQKILEPFNVQFEEFLRVVQGAGDKHRELGRFQKRIRGASPAQAEKIAKDFNEKYAKKFGVMLDKTGNRFVAQLDKDGNLAKGERLKNTVQGVIKGMGASRTGGGDPKKDQERAKTMLDYTKSLSDYWMKQGDSYLSKIAENTQSILNWLNSFRPTPATEEGKKKRIEAKEAERRAADAKTEIEKKVWKNTASVRKREAEKADYNAMPLWKKSALHAARGAVSTSTLGLGTGMFDEAARSFGLGGGLPEKTLLEDAKDHWSQRIGDKDVKTGGDVSKAPSRRSGPTNVINYWYDHSDRVVSTIHNYEKALGNV